MNRTHRPSPNRLFLLVPPALIAALAIGCGRGPQVSSANREIIVSLATAVSTRDAKAVDANAELVEKQRAAGECPDAEYEAFQNIIAKAKAGDWDAAQTAAYDLRDAQEPTAEDVKKLAERKLSSDHHGLTKTKSGGIKKP